MAEVQDDDQWLYGDDKEEHGIRGKDTGTNLSVNETQQPIVRDKPTAPIAGFTSLKSRTNLGKGFGLESNEETPLPVTTETNGEVNESNEKNKDVGHEDAQETQQNGEKAKNDADDDSSSDDEPTVTIGKIVKQPDIMRPPPPTHRSAPTSGLKDEDFSCVGKINGVPAPDYNLAELEEKPWRKPGADLSDYFNYGFTEDTWIKYCERQKSMRITESGIGLTGLGINVGKSMLGSSNIPVSIVNENSKYGGLRKPAGVPIVKTKMTDDDSGGLTNQTPNVNTIQVMTADRRTYSSKVLSGQNTYDEVDFGGNPYGNDFFNTPPPANFFTPPPWGGVPNLPPPGWTPDGIGAPPPMPHHRGVAYFDEDSVGALGNSNRSSKDEREMEKIRESLESRESRDRESRHHSSRRRSRSRSKSRHRRRSRSRSRSRSPSHRHKRKKSKRDRETE